MENREQLSAAFIPYLREFLARAKLAKPELAQVLVPVDLAVIPAIYAVVKQYELRRATSSLAKQAQPESLA